MIFLIFGSFLVLFEKKKTKWTRELLSTIRFAIIITSMLMVTGGSIFALFTSKDDDRTYKESYSFALAIYNNDQLH